MKVGAGQLDLAVVPPPAYSAMKRGVGPFEQAADQAKALSGNLGTLFTFPGGSFHPIVWADIGIESWEDLKSKRIDVGPPAGAAAQGREASGGFDAGTDYEGIRLPWEASSQALQDGQFDMFIMSAAVEQQSVQELSLQREIRVPGVPDEVVARNYEEQGIAIPDRLKAD
ncbi:NMT1-like family protein [Salipiger thiooxidans]|uniref:NMT1-like family protein n=2 Tax=Salipiger thiooxidans TaxID=282683 RepID=A0A1G7DZ76_9RHOB|nr:NMT1-like family protein [Salipiger thiooxidans]